jgi:MinD-like ATPase involved in chromosome partitioning or flagellar assembly
MESLRLKNRSLALVQLKGGVGKTLLAANLAGIAAARQNWTTVLLDLDANAPLTGAALGSQNGSGTIIEALARTAKGQPVDELLVYAPNLGVYLLKGDPRGIPSSMLGFLPQLIREIHGSYIATPDGSKPVEFVLVDPPGENREINLAVLSAVDAAATPVMVSSPDMAATGLTLQLIAAAQSKRGGSPAFLGLIPNRVSRRGSIERAFLDVILKSSKVLPYLPTSDVLRGTFVRRSRQGGETVIHFSPRSTSARRLVYLWEAMNGPPDQGALYAEEFCRYVQNGRTPHASKEAEYAKHRG